MAILFMDGFDHYVEADITKKWTSASNAAYTTMGTTGGRHGGYLGVSGNQGYIYKVFSSGLATVYTGFACSIAAYSTGDITLASFRDATVLHLVLCVNSSNILEVRLGSSTGTLIGSGSSVVSESAWHYIEWAVTIDNTAGAVIVKVDGVTEINVSGVDTQNGGTATATTLWLGAASNGRVCFFDDLYISDSALLGDVRIDTLYPTSDGAHTDFTPSTGTSHYACVDEPQIGLSDSVYSSTVGAVDTYGLGDLPSGASGTIYAVQVNNIASKSDAGARSIASVVRSGTSESTSSATALASTAVDNLAIFATDPATSTAWTVSGINGMEAGTKVAA